jgi:four helix bundle protein
MKNFKGLKVWQKGFEIAVKTYQLTETFPKEEKFGISFQINRSAVSISSNIAEGSSRTSEKDYKRYLEIALGSCFELETQLLIAKAAKMGEINRLDPILQDIDEEQKMLMAFIRSLEK